MSEDEGTRPYAGPGDETERRRDMPDAHEDAKQFVEEVDSEVPEEHLETRVDETFDDRAEPSSG